MSNGTRPKKPDGEDEKSRRKQRKVEERCFTKPVNISKVNMPVIKRWITQALEDQLPDDDVAVEFIYELLVGAENDEPDAGVIREQLNDFVGKDKSRIFCVDLWQLLLNGQESPDGIPQKLVDERKAEMEKDDRARRETDLILTQLRPKPTLVKRSVQYEKSGNSDKRDPIKPVVEGNKVSKPGRSDGRKTNYNRS